MCHGAVLRKVRRSVSMSASAMNDLKKPLPVTIVETLGWIYVMLSVLLFILAIVNACRGSDESLSGILFVLLFGLCLLSLPVGMVFALRLGRRTWFLVPNTIVMSLCLIGAIEALCSSATALPFVLLALLFGIGPMVLLFLPSSSRWFNEMSGDDSPSPFGCAGIVVVGVLWLAFVGPCLSEMYFSKIGMQNALSHAMAARGRALWGCIVFNHSREAGKDWVDASSCTNSTQFVQALWAKLGEDKAPCPYPDSWCIAVNPPDNDKFPVMVTANIDPRELLCSQDKDQPLKLTCPKEWGGTCFKFCEKAGVIVYKGGASQIFKNKYVRPSLIFNDGIPKPGPDTYFLTPTGRVDFVERQAAVSL